MNPAVPRSALLTNGDDGHLFVPGGRREPGEEPEDCARREVREEAGVTARSWTPPFRTVP